MRKEKSGTCYLIGAGDFGDGNPCPGEGDLVIAGDGGYQACLERKIRIDQVIGDFDSLGYIPKAADVTVLPVRKDDTDMRAAMLAGWERGYRRFLIYGGTGGRISHTIANITLLDEITAMGGSACMIGYGTVYTIIRGESGREDGLFRFGKEKRGSLSVFAWGGDAEGICIRGLSYELEDGKLQPQYPLGVSNSYCGKDGEIRIRQGRLLIIEEK